MLHQFLFSSFGFLCTDRWTDAVKNNTCFTSMASAQAVKPAENENWIHCNVTVLMFCQEAFPQGVCFNGRTDGIERLPNTCNFSITGTNLQGMIVRYYLL